jgi:hypothetical protein
MSSSKLQHGIIELSVNYHTSIFIKEKIGKNVSLLYRVFFEQRVAGDPYNDLLNELLNSLR